MALGIPNQKRPLGRQIGVLFWRGLLDMLRNPLLTAFHALGGLLLGLLVGIIFFSGAQSTHISDCMLDMFHGMCFVVPLFCGLLDMLRNPLEIACNALGGLLLGLLVGIIFFSGAQAITSCLL
jgi:hypothetical protein